MTYQEIKDLYQSHGYKFFTGKFALNIFGIRNGYEVVDEFNDQLGVAYHDDFGNEICLVHKGTTKPGLYYLKNKLGNADGTFILKPNQYLNCWQIGPHNWKYHALRQKGMPFEGWRDNDQDGELDIDGSIYTNVKGLNSHTTSFKTLIEKVGAYGAGCQVRQHHEDHEMFMAVVDRAFQVWGNDTFSYTLFDAA